MKVKELILSLLEMPQNAEVVCRRTGGYLTPYSVDTLKHFSTDTLDGLKPTFFTSNDVCCNSDDVVFIGSSQDERQITKRYFPFKEFFKPGFQRNLKSYR